MNWSIVVEGQSDIPIVEAILRTCGHDVDRRYVTGGKDRLDDRIRGYIGASRFSPFLIVRDLDDEKCAPTLAARLRAGTNAPFVRIAVRTIEAWLLADNQRAAAWLGVNVTVVPKAPESLSSPKQTLIKLARRSRLRVIRDGIPPADPAYARVGPGYLSLVKEFCESGWRPTAAAERSDSLRRLLQRLERAR